MTTARPNGFLNHVLCTKTLVCVAHDDGRDRDRNQDCREDEEPYADSLG